jgi:hypothetical protein
LPRIKACSKRLEAEAEGTEASCCSGSSSNSTFSSWAKPSGLEAKVAAAALGFPVAGGFFNNQGWSRGVDAGCGGCGATASATRAAASEVEAEAVFGGSS